MSARRSSPLDAALWMAVGASAGVALGFVLARRARGRRTLADRLLGILDGVERWTAVLAPQAADLDEAVADASATEDDDDESAARGASDDESGDADEYDEYGAEDPPVDVRVLTAFEQDPLLSQRAIEIDEPERATIVLAGRVPSTADAEHAVIIARGTPGVERVINRLRVRQTRDPR